MSQSVICKLVSKSHPWEWHRWMTIAIRRKSCRANGQQHASHRRGGDQMVAGSIPVIWDSEIFFWLYDKAWVANSLTTKAASQFKTYACNALAVPFRDECRQTCELTVRSSCSLKIDSQTILRLSSLFKLWLQKPQTSGVRWNCEMIDLNTH